MLRTVSANPFPAVTAEGEPVIVAGMSTTVALRRNSGEAQEAGTDRRLDKRSLGQASAAINRQCDGSRRLDIPGSTTLLHELASARRRIDEMAALPAVSAAAPPTTKAAFQKRGPVGAAAHGGK